MVVRRLVAALAGLAVASGACAGGRDVASTERPLVVVLRSVPDPHHGAFLDELGAHRFAVGRAIDLVPPDGKETFGDADAVAAALAGLDRSPTVVVAYSTPLAQTAVELLADTPMVAVVNDPVTSGLVEDRRRPEGLITGVTYASPADRTLELTGRLFPGLDRIGYLAPTGDPAVEGHRAGVLAAAEAAGVDVVEATFTGDAEVPTAVQVLLEAEVDAAILASANATYAAYDALAEAVTDAQLPVVSNNARADFAVLALEPDGAELRRQVARQVARLLAGHPVRQIPVEDPRRFRLVLDRSLAMALGVDGMDEGLLRQADDVR